MNAKSVKNAGGRVTRLDMLHVYMYVLIVGEVDMSFLLILGKLQTLDVLLQRLKAGGHRYGAKLVRGSTQVKKVQQPRPLHTESPVATEAFHLLDPIG